MVTPSDDVFLERAAALSIASVEIGGGPFGAVVVMGDTIIGEGANGVTIDADPTAHAEVVAIRAACRTLGTHELRGAVLYTSCEPCPMCLGAAYWARVDRVVFANDRADAAAIGFDDEFIYAEIGRPLAERKLDFERRENASARQAFADWQAKTDRVDY